MMTRPEPVFRDLDGPASGADMRPLVALRSPDSVMRLARLGSFHQTRLSFMRVLLRRLDRDGWTILARLASTWMRAAKASRSIAPQVPRAAIASSPSPMICRRRNEPIG